MMFDLENSLCVSVGVARPKRLLNLMVRLVASSEEKLRGRCDMVYRVQQELMRVALGTYGKTKASYGCPTCKFGS
jgi:hypothetical protein